MGTVVLHAGMGKAGSTSVQFWLAENAARLRGLGSQLLVPPEESDARTADRLRLKAYTSGAANANLLAMALRLDGDEREAWLDSLFEQLDAAAERDRW